MTTHRTPPPLPTSIWVIAGASVASQLVPLVRRGVRHDDGLSLAVSVVLGALVIGYISAGVVRARTVRLVLVWVVLVLSSIAELLGLLTADEPADVALYALLLVTSVVLLTALAKFSRTEWFAWQRTKPPAQDGASIRGLVAIAVLVGALGGLVGPVDDGVDVSFDVATRAPS
ncbi:hypothetical protein ASE01_03475 [Nocardioides sp. Root190]|uniref:hypothetical protein n=1 Tax=Nocardioides sp. Root190 TaxID=1736488 RepID=UPI0006F35EA7|nr:hypothetical protein [Nocardioides sp. Root190]KRB78351.1 hypothetical protein ASE01_03475 [Nocardioides sp. Root190]